MQLSLVYISAVLLAVLLPLEICARELAQTNEDIVLWDDVFSDAKTMEPLHLLIAPTPTELDMTMAEAIINDVAAYISEALNDEMDSTASISGVDFKDITGTQFIPAGRLRRTRRSLSNLTATHISISSVEKRRLNQMPATLLEINGIRVRYSGDEPSDAVLKTMIQGVVNNGDVVAYLDSKDISFQDMSLAWSSDDYQLPSPPTPSLVPIVPQEEKEPIVSQPEPETKPNFDVLLEDNTGTPDESVNSMAPYIVLIGTLACVMVIASLFVFRQRRKRLPYRQENVTGSGILYVNDPNEMNRGGDIGAFPILSPNRDPRVSNKSPADIEIAVIDGDSEVSSLSSYGRGVGGGGLPLSLNRVYNQMYVGTTEGFDHLGAPSLLLAAASDSLKYSSSEAEEDDTLHFELNKEWSSNGEENASDSMEEQLMFHASPLRSGSSIKKAPSSAATKSIKSKKSKNDKFLDHGIVSTGDDQSSLGLPSIN